MTLPTYDKGKRYRFRFGTTTVTFSVRIPRETRQKIHDRNLDMPQIVYDIVEKDLNPYSNEPVIDPIMKKLTTKLIGLMINEKMTVAEDFFTLPERQLIIDLSEEIS